MPRNNRPSTRFLHVRPDKFIFSPLSINDTSKREEELWMILEQYSEVTDVRREFIRSLGITNSNTIKKIGKEFQSFVRQAKNYYVSAKKLPNSSRALLYYYSFLNLAKALLILYYPSRISGRVYHGLKCDSKRQANFKNEHVYSDGGVFKVLYEHETGEVLRNKTSFSILQLLGYCTDISYQYLSANFGKILNARGSMMVFINSETQKAWGTLAIHNFDDLEKYRKRIRRFSTEYEKVSMNHQISRECFGMLGSQRALFSFYEGKEYDLGSNGVIPDNRIIEDLNNCLKGLLIPNHYDEENIDFYIAYPYRKNKQLLMNEFLSIFVVMFYLSSLVRYQPYYLDKIFDKKESWVIKGFIESCPHTFLLYIVSKIVKKNLILTPR